MTSPTPTLPPSDDCSDLDAWDTPPGPQLPPSLPPDLERIPAGLFLTVALHGVDRTRLSAADTVRLVKARDRLISHLQAGKARDIAECASRCPGDDVAVSEIGAALVLTDTAAGIEWDLGRRPG